MFRLKKISAVVMLLGFAGTSWCSSASHPQLTVYVNDTAHTPGRSLSDAEREAARVFRNAGISVEWVNCARDEASANVSRCRQTPAPGELVIRIIPQARQAAQNVTGTSFLGPSGGVYADIFLDRVLDLQQGDPSLSLPAILGDVIAHELGHLLLGENSHTHFGLMQPNWTYSQLRLIEMGQLRFSSSEASQLRERITVLQSGALLAHQDGPATH